MKTLAELYKVHAKARAFAKGPDGEGECSELRWYCIKFKTCSGKEACSRERGQLEEGRLALPTACPGSLESIMNSRT